MADFNKILGWLFKWEGGFQNQTTDRGNYDSSGRLIGTNKGVSAIAYEEYLRQTTGESLPKIPLQTAINRIKNLTDADAKKIGKKLFWDAIRGDEIKDQSVAEVIFQWYWGNPYNGMIRSQDAIDGMVKGITPDAKLTKEEVQAINKYPNQKKLFEAIKQAQYQWYDSLNNPYYEEGWLRRILSMEYKLGGKSGSVNLVIPILILTASLIGVFVYLGTRKKT